MARLKICILRFKEALVNGKKGGNEPKQDVWVLWRLCLIGSLDMSGADEKLLVVLEGYSNFLREKKLALPKHQPHLVRWVRQFLLFARKYSDYTFEQTLDSFLTALGQRPGVDPWQIQQAADAIRIYHYQYRGYRGRREFEPKGIGASGNDESLLERLREVIRLRHYARSTEKTYLHWTRRFLAYRKHAGLGVSRPLRM